MLCAAKPRAGQTADPEGVLCVADPEGGPMGVGNVDPEVGLRVDERSMVDRR